MLWEVFVLVMKTLDSLNGKLNDKQTEIETMKGRMNQLEKENKKLKVQFSDISKNVRGLEHSLDEIERKTKNLNTLISFMEIGNFDDMIKMIGANKPTPLSLLKAKYPFLNNRINVEICGRWHMKIGGKVKDKYPSDCYKLLIEGEEKIHFKNAATGETSGDYNMF